MVQLGLVPVIAIPSSSFTYIRTFLNTKISIHGKAVNSKTETGDGDRISEPLSVYLIRKTENIEEKITESVFQNRVPIVLIHERSVSPRMELESLVKSLRVSKLIYLTRRGGIWDKNENYRYSIINSEKDFSDLDSGDNFSSEDQALLRDAVTILKNRFSTEHRFTISVTSPTGFLKELFTVKGSGTLVKRGSKILYFNSIRMTDQTRLKTLIENSFRKICKPEFLNQEFTGILLESNYQACALLLSTENGILLSKFAVDEIARGEGIGREIWDEMKTRYSTIFWRAKSKNSINKWYVKESEGMQKMGDWFFYWIGLEPKKIPEIIQFLKDLPEDLVEAEADGSRIL
jgi:acetylglutamate kinase